MVHLTKPLRIGALDARDPGCHRPGYRVPVSSALHDSTALATRSAVADAYTDYHDYIENAWKDDSAAGGPSKKLPRPPRKAIMAARDGGARCTCVTAAAAKLPKSPTARISTTNLKPRIPPRMP